MNARVSLPELSRMIADGTGFDIKACELFMRELFATVAETIVAGENVKVKGIGTFKSINVEQRKSVNVNTGEQMIIPEHRKVTFTPDKALAEAVNAPFAMFEPVELNDTVTDEMLETAEQEETGTTARPAFQEKKADGSADIVPEEPETPYTEPETPCTEPQANNADSIPEISENLSTTVPETLIEVEVEPKPTTPSPALSQIVSTPSPSIPADPEPAKEPEPAPQPQEHHVIPVMPCTAEYEEDDIDSCHETNGNRHRSGHFGRGFLIGALCSFAIIGIAILAWRIVMPDSFEAVISALNTDRQTEIASHAVTAKVVGKPQEGTGTTKINVPEEAVKTIEPVENKESADVPTETSDKQLKADINEKSTKGSTAKEPEIFTDKITKKRYLTTMAREYYGNYNLWPLIYDYNAGLGHPDRIRPGTKIKVPSAETLGIDPKDPAVIKKAKNRGAEIYRKYKKS